ncbi:MAG: stage III sporulation protein AB [Clostridia bacterium]|nr:stage III sporulation protein AB [Clostridia bacterium]
MIKLIGAIFIFAASVSVGFSASAMYRVRAEQLEAFGALITHIGAQIGGFLAPLDRIYCDFKDARLEKCGFLRVLRSSGASAALGECRESLFLNDGEIGELEKFFSSLGRGDANEEERHCAYFAKRFARFYESARNESASKGRLFRTFGFLSGLMLAVILV